MPSSLQASQGCFLLLKKKEEKEEEKDKDKDAHGRSKKIAGTHKNIFPPILLWRFLSPISKDLMFFGWKIFLQFPG
jgi:hypothetical protein